MAEISLLIGNGFNRLEDDGFPSWDSLIKTPVKDNIDRAKNDPKKFTDIKDMSYPLKFEYIVNFINENGKNCCDTYLEIKNQIAERLNVSIQKSDHKIDSEIATILKKIAPQNILTTNYDDMLEKVFISRKSKSGYSDKFKENNKDKEIFLNRTRVLGQEGKKTNFYHIHGIDVIPQSICLGYEHYMRIINRLRKRVIGFKEEQPRIIDFLNDNTALGTDFLNEFETKFFNTDVYIIGLGLSSQEVDLWWLLCYRAYLYFANVNGAKTLINNKIVYLDVHPTKITADGYSYEDDYQKQQKEMFKYMKVEYEPLEVVGNSGDDMKKAFKDKYLEALKKIPT